LLQRDRPREAPQRGRLQLDEQLRDLLVRAVLQEPCEQQVARLEQRVAAVLRGRLGVGQQPGGLQVEQRGRDDEELRGLVEVRVVAERGEVGDEVVGDAVQGQLRDVELVLADQLQQQIERAGEVVEANREPRWGARRDRDRPVVEPSLIEQRHRARTSRASSRYAMAPADVGAQVVIGSPATVVSGNRTVRLITAWNTRSPNASRTRCCTSRVCRVRGSNIVARMPSTSRFGLSRSRTFSIVSISSATPRRLKNSQASGMSTVSAQARALIVSRPSEGWQSISTMS